MIQELYRFEEGTSVFTITSGKKPVVFESETYLPSTITRNEIETSDDLNKSELEIRTSIDNEISLPWLTTDSEEIVTLKLIAIEDGIPNILFRGRLTIPSVDGSEIVLKFEPGFTKQRRFGFTRKYQRTCSHALFRGRCGAVQADFEQTVTITAINGNVLTVTEAASFEDDWFTAGKVIVGNYTRYIIDHAGDQITLIRPFANLSVSDLPFQTIITPGCNKHISTCHDKFNVVKDHGGFEYMPTVNPFSLTSVV
jgi:uncharacterized phage protein (TIGR02218 family)